MKYTNVQTDMSGIQECDTSVLTMEALIFLFLRLYGL